MIAFVERYLTTPKGTGARKRMQLRPWQREIVHGLFDEPRPRHGLVAIPRGNGKSTLAAALALYGLLADGVEGAQVLCVASDQRQAEIVFRAARRMVELNPELADRLQVFQRHLYARTPTRRWSRCPPSPARCRVTTRAWPLSTSCTSSPMRCTRP